jgi:hypothetical protein
MKKATNAVSCGWPAPCTAGNAYEVANSRRTRIRSFVPFDMASSGATVWHNVSPLSARGGDGACSYYCAALAVAVHCMGRYAAAQSPPDSGGHAVSLFAASWTSPQPRHVAIALNHPYASSHCDSGMSSMPSPQS